MLAIRSWVIDNSFDRQAVQAQQQPAAQLLIDRVVPIAHRSLRHLRQQRLRVAQQHVLQRPGALELASASWRRRAGKALPALCTTARLGVVWPPMKSAMPTSPFVADHRNLGRRIRLPSRTAATRSNRSESRRALRRAAGFVEHLA
jgi:hypothetical protein